MILHGLAEDLIKVRGAIAGNGFEISFVLGINAMGEVVANRNRSQFGWREKRLQDIDPFKGHDRDL